MKKTSNKYEILFVSIECLLAIVAYMIDSNVLKMIIIFFAFYSTYFFKKVNPTLLFFSVEPLINFESNGMVLLLITMPAYLNKTTFRCIKRKNGLLYIVLLLLIATFSYTAGIDPNFKTILLLLRCVFIFLTTFNSNISEDKFKLYTYFRFLVIIFILLIQYNTGTISMYYGRLALNGNVRELANAIAIPTFVFGTSLLNSKNKVKNIIINLSLFVICSFILLATSSRGVLFSTFFSLAIYYLCSKSNLNFKKIFISLIILVSSIYLINYIQSLNIFRVERIFVDANGGLNGREEIWKTYLSYEFSSIKTILFGFGPGNVNRLGISTFYSHSLILDWLFSFGVLGFLYLIVGLFKIGFGVIKNKNKFYLSLFVLAIMLFSTHGVMTDCLFYILISVSCYSFKSNELGEW